MVIVVVISFGDDEYVIDLTNGPQELVEGVLFCYSMIFNRPFI